MWACWPTSVPCLSLLVAAKDTLRCSLSLSIVIALALYETSASVFTRPRTHDTCTGKAGQDREQHKSTATSNTPHGATLLFYACSSCNETRLGLLHHEIPMFFTPTLKHMGGDVCRHSRTEAVWQALTRTHTYFTVVPACSSVGISSVGRVCDDLPCGAGRRL